MKKVKMKKYKLINQKGHNPFLRGCVYNEDSLGSYITVKESVKRYPDDWELVECKDYIFDETINEIYNEDIQEALSGFSNVDKSMIKEKELIGYRLKKEYQKNSSVISIICKIEDDISSVIYNIKTNLFFSTVEFRKEPDFKRLEESGLLNLWFEPIFEEVNKKKE